MTKFTGCPHCKSTSFTEHGTRAISQRFDLPESDDDGSPAQYTDANWHSYDVGDDTDVDEIECEGCGTKWGSVESFDSALVQWDTDDEDEEDPTPFEVHVAIVIGSMTDDELRVLRDRITDRVGASSEVAQCPRCGHVQALDSDDEHECMYDEKDTADA